MLNKMMKDNSRILENFKSGLTVAIQTKNLDKFLDNFKKELRKLLISQKQLN